MLRELLRRDAAEPAPAVHVAGAGPGPPSTAAASACSAAARPAAPRCRCRARASGGRRTRRSGGASSASRGPASPPLWTKWVTASIDLAVHVELELVAGRVADPDRARPRVASQVGQLRLRRGRFAVDVVDDPQLRPGQARGVQQPADERLGLLPVPEAEEGPGGERRVAQPAEAVVPVQVAADALRQRRGRRGDDGPGRGVGHELQGQRAAHHLRPGTARRSGRGPPSAATTRRSGRASG